MGNTLRLSLLRSSFAPDPYPELGSHEIHLAVRPLERRFSTSGAIEAARAFDHPVRVIGTDAHPGRLPSHGYFVKWSGEKIILNSVKKAETEDAIIIKLYNPTDTAETGVLSIDPGAFGALSRAWETDLMERPLDSAESDSPARADGNNVNITVPAKGIICVGLEFDSP